PLDVLVPAHGVATGRPLEVELGAVEAESGTEHVGNEIDDGGVPGKGPELGVLVHRFAEAPDVRLRGSVVGSQVELIVGGGERARLLDLGGDDGAQSPEPLGADVARQRKET